MSLMQLIHRLKLFAISKNSINCCIVVIAYKFTDVFITYNRDVAELVRACDSVVVENAGVGDPARLSVVSKYNQLILCSLVAHHVDALLHITHKDAVTHVLYVYDKVGNVLEMSKRKSLRTKYAVKVHLLYLMYCNTLLRYS